MRRNIIAPIIGTILTLGVLGVGGYALYQTGYQNGLAETASEVVVRGPHFYPPFGFFFGFIFLLFLFGFISRLFSWGRWRGGGYGPRDHGEGSPMEKRLDDWHERAHKTQRKYRSDEPDTT